MIDIEITESADSNWNKRLLESNFATESQLLEAKFQFLSNNQIPKFLLFLNNSGEIIGQLLLSEIDRLKQNPHRKKKIVNNFSNFLQFYPLLKLKQKCTDGRMVL